ncbi:hypothetical protein I4U23_019785 [Adineta vaga]|nr:hypothetical protein I4U23_019785 [Adineta vaga]
MATNDDVFNSIKSSLQSENYTIFTSINEWERHSIGKIQLVAEQVRNDLKRLFDKKREDVHNLLIQSNNRIDRNSMINNDLIDLTKELHKFREELLNLTSKIHIEHDKNQSPIYLIKLLPQQKDRISTSLDERTIDVPGTKLLTLSRLHQMTIIEQKQVLGERLFVLIQQIEPRLAAKITGMFLELDIKYILMLIKSDAILKEKIKEAINVLRVHQHKQRHVTER